jgi:hypothetical protein
MIRVLKILIIIFSFNASSVRADSAIQNLEKLTGTSIALLSGMLSEYQKQLSDVKSKRTDIIVAVERMAADGQFQVDREVGILKQTGGETVVKVLDAIRDHAVKAASASDQLDIVQAQVEKEITAIYKPLSISTEKLDVAAKMLATLASEKTLEENFEFLASYLMEVRKSVDELKKKGSDSKDAGDKALDSKMNNLNPLKQLDSLKAGLLLQLNNK